MKTIISTFIKIIFTTSIILTSTFSCGDKNLVVPYVYVHFEVYLNDPDMQELIPIGGKVFVNGGHRGIVIYRRTLEEFAAYDRACTYHPNEECRVQDGETWGELECDCCDSKYQLFQDGFPSEGPATIGLHKYKVTYYKNSETLVISN